MKKNRRVFCERTISLFLTALILWMPYHNSRAQEAYGTNSAAISGVPTIKFVDPEIPKIVSTASAMDQRTMEENRTVDALFWQVLLSIGTDYLSPEFSAALVPILVGITVAIAIGVIVWMLYNVREWAKKLMAPPPDPQPPQQLTNAQNAQLTFAASSGNSTPGGFGTMENNKYHWAPTDAFSFEIPSLYIESDDLVQYIAPTRTVCTFTNSCVRMQTYVLDVLVQTDAYILGVTNSNGTLAYYAPLTFTNRVDTSLAPKKFYRLLEDFTPQSPQTNSITFLK